MQFGQKESRGNDVKWGVEVDTMHQTQMTLFDTASKTLFTGPRKSLPHKANQANEGKWDVVFFLKKLNSSTKTNKN